MRMTIAPMQPDAARALLLILRQLPRQDRDEDDVVDAEDDLEERQRDERDEQLGHREVAPPNLHLRAWRPAGVLEVLEAQAVPAAGERQAILFRPWIDQRSITSLSSSHTRMPSSLVIDSS